jgi:hypothetical protein
MSFLLEPSIHSVLPLTSMVIFLSFQQPLIMSQNWPWVSATASCGGLTGLG